VDRTADIVFTIKAAGYKSERLPELVADLVRLKMDVVIADGAEAALAAERGIGGSGN
jgi:soluble P-type ATPase